MITIWISSFIFKRRHFARNSKILIPGVSSINIFAELNLSTALWTCCHSYSSNWAFLNLEPGISASIEINLVTNWILAISKENMATGLSKSKAAFLAIAKVKAVLPIPGLAATIIKSEGCHPEVSLSNSENPVGIPVSPCSFWESSSSIFCALIAITPTLIDPLFKCCWVISNKPFSASSNISKTSLVSSKESLMILVDTFINSRWIFFWEMILAWYSILAPDATIFVNSTKYCGPPAISNSPDFRNPSFTVRISIGWDLSNKFIITRYITWCAVL